MARNKYLDDNFPSAADVRRTKSNKQVMMEKLHDEVVEWLNNTVKPSILNARLNEETSVNVEFRLLSIFPQVQPMPAPMLS
jgi:hypothetical protein